MNILIRSLYQNHLHPLTNYLLGIIPIIVLMMLKLKKLKYLELKFDFDIKYSEEKMKKELAELDTNWEVRFHEFQLNSQKLESDLNIRQNYEIVELTKQLELSMGKFIKYSNNYLDLKKQQENLIKQQL